MSRVRWQVWGSWAALSGVTMFVATVVPLHFLQPGYEPANQLMSELALGRYGWVMYFAFGGWRSQPLAPNQQSVFTALHGA